MVYTARNKTAGAETSSDLWRRVEQHGLDDALKRLSKTKHELSIISTLSSEDAANLTGVMVELTELLNCIRLAYVDNEKEILEDEYETRFLPEIRPKILEVWTSFSDFATRFAMNIAQKCWTNSSEETELLRMTVEVVAASVKLLVLSVDSVGGVDKFYSDVQKELIVGCSDLGTFIRNVLDLGREHSTYDFMTEMVGWNFYAINHLCNRIIRPAMEAKDKDSSSEEFESLTDSIERLLTTMKTFIGIKDKEPEKTAAPEPPQIKDSGKKANKKTDHKESKSVVKAEHQVTIDEKKSSKDHNLDVFKNLSETYAVYSDEAWEKKQLPVLQGTSGVRIKYRMESYKELGRTSIKPCPMIQRKSLLDKLSITDNHQIASEIFVFDPEGLVCSNEIEVEMPILSFSTPEDGNMVLKIKADGTWSDFTLYKKINIDEEPGLRFSTQHCEAFVAVTYNSHTEFVVGSTGGNYISEAVGRVEIHVPPDCYDHETTLQIKTIPFDTSSYPDLFVGVVAASVAIDIAPHDSYKDMKKQITVQLPIKYDEESKDTDVVVVRYNGEQIHVLDRKQIPLSTVDTGLYTVDIKDYWCVSVLRIKKVFLNMRDTIKKEFLAGYRKKIPCKLITFIDAVTRGNERQTFVMEAVEKCNADTTANLKRDFGLVEIKNSRSKDVLLKTGEVIQMKTDGQMRPTEALSDDHYNMCFIPGLPNVIHVATEVKRDPEKMPDAMLIYRRQSEQTVVHSIALMTRELSELPTEAIKARTVSSIHIMDKKHVQDDENSINVLKMESLMSLARELTFDEGSQLGHRLGVKPEKILQIKEDADKDIVKANFQILCQWRGRFARATMADFLVSCLKAVGKTDYATILTNVRRQNRVLEKKDFEKKKSKAYEI